MKLIKETGAESAVDLVEGWHTTLLFTETEVLAHKADYAAAQAAGINVTDVKFLTKEEVKEVSIQEPLFSVQRLTNPQTYGAEYPGIHAPGHNLWPLKLVTHLYNLTKNTLGPNLTLHTNTPVTSITPIPSDTVSSRRWNLTTPRGPIACSYVLHATNAYASHLLPHMHGPSGIIPTRGQIIALRAAAPLEEITKSSWDGNDGFEYWFPRPLSGEETEPLVILGGGRESTRPKFELYTVDDSTLNPAAGDTLRKFLPAAFPGKYEPGREPEMEWVSESYVLSEGKTNQLDTDWYHGLHKDARSIRGWSFCLTRQDRTYHSIPGRTGHRSSSTRRAQRPVHCRRVHWAWHASDVRMVSLSIVLASLHV